MNKQVPSLGKILVMVGFALLCFVLLLWLWLSFGGSTPLRPDGYRFQVPFGEATQLAKEADVRIAGINVGKVKGLQTNKQTGQSIATIEIQPKFAPVPVDTRATLRQKTLLGETYIELTPGSPGSPKLKEGDMLAAAQVAPSVELDKILRTFDPETRKALSNWIYQMALSLRGRSGDLSQLIGNLPGFEQQMTELLTTVDQQGQAVSQFSRSTATVLDALTERDGQLGQFIDSSSKVFSTTGARNRQLADAIRALPTFQRELGATVTRLTAYAKDTDPLVRELMPSAQEFTPMVKALVATGPDLRAALTRIGPLTKASERGLPAMTRLVAELRAFLPEVDSPLSQLAPILDSANLYRSDITAALANSAAATQFRQQINGGSTYRHMLKLTNPVFPESLSQYTSRLPTTRQNAYGWPGAGLSITSGMPVYDDRSCGGDMTFTVENPGTIRDDFAQSITKWALTGGTVQSMPCIQQPRFNLNGTITRFPQVQPNPAGLLPGPPTP